MPKFTKLRMVLHQWGGATAGFFTFTHLSHDLSGGLLVAMLPIIRAELGLSYLQSGLLLSAFTITMGLSQFPGGWLGDRLSRHVVVAIGLGGVGLSAFFLGLSSVYYTMLVILVVMGIFAGAYHPTATSMLSSYFEEARRGRVIALHMVGGSLGFSIGPILGGLIADTLGWRFAFIILSMLPLVAVPLVLIKFRQRGHPGGSERRGDTSTDDGTALKPSHRLSSLGRVLRPVAIVLALTVLVQLVVGSAMAFIPLYLVDKHNVAMAYAAIWLGITRGGGIAGSLLGGWLSDKWGRKNAILLALVSTGPILYLLTKLQFNVPLMVILVLFGMLMIMRQTTAQAFLMDNTPPQLRATVFGIYFGLGMEGMSLAQPVAGHFMDIYGIVNVFNVIAIISLASSLLALLLVKKI